MKYYPAIDDITEESTRERTDVSSETDRSQYSSIDTTSVDVINCVDCLFCARDAYSESTSSDASASFVEEKRKHAERQVKHHGRQDKTKATMRDELEEDETGYWPRMFTGEGGGLCTAVNLNLPPNMIGRFVVCTGNNDEVSAITTPKELTMKYPRIVLDPNEYYSPPNLQSRPSLKSVPTMQSNHSAHTTSRLSVNSMKPIGILRKSKRKKSNMKVRRTRYVLDDKSLYEV